MLLSREEEGMKTRLNKLSSEHGKLELEDKVLITQRVHLTLSFLLLSISNTSSV